MFVLLHAALLISPLLPASPPPVSPPPVIELSAVPSSLDASAELTVTYSCTGASPLEVAPSVDWDVRSRSDVVSVRGGQSGATRSLTLTLAPRRLGRLALPEVRSRVVGAELRSAPTYVVVRGALPRVSTGPEPTRLGPGDLGKDVMLSWEAPASAVAGTQVTVALVLLAPEGLVLRGLAVAEPERPAARTALERAPEAARSAFAPRPAYTRVVLLAERWRVPAAGTLSAKGGLVVVETATKKYPLDIPTLELAVVPR